MVSVEEFEVWVALVEKVTAEDGWLDRLMLQAQRSVEKPQVKRRVVVYPPSYRASVFYGQMGETA